MDINKSLCKHDLDSNNHPKVASQGQSKWFDNCKICLPHYLIHSQDSIKYFLQNSKYVLKKIVEGDIFAENQASFIDVHKYLGKI